MSKIDPELLILAENLVAYGRKKGADQVQVSIGEGREFSVDVREGNIEKLTDAGLKSLSLKVIKEDRVATASSSDFSGDTLHRLVENAVSRAALSNPDEFAGLPDRDDVVVDADALDIFDPEILEIPADRKIAAARETEAVCLADKRVGKSFGASYGTYSGTSYLVNSNGFSGAFLRTSCYCGVYLQSGEGDNLFDEGWYDSARRLGDLMAPEAIGRKAVNRVTRLIGARKIETQNVPVVMEPRMTASLLGFLNTCVSGRNIYLKQSFLANKLGETVGNSAVMVVDDGLIPGAAGTRPFDSEGVHARRTAVIENGVLRNYLLDTYAARKLGMKSTGNASGAQNFYLQAGNQSPEEIIRSVDKGLLLTGTIGFGLVPTTGDISRGAFGLWIENGEPVYPVAEITISGNLGTILKEIDSIGNDLEFKRSISGPTIKVREMTIGGI
ncbi:MAG TPA: TldD/PmbA family protein [bacterium]|nr:TldD/PmbA family protein [bacterium]